MSVLGTVISIVLFLPFVYWGVKTLQMRYVWHEEIPMRVEAISVAGLVAFCLVQLFLLRGMIDAGPVLFIFAGLGVFVAGAALYGHMLVSLVAQLLVEAMMPHGEHDPNKPQLGPAEALERQGDYEGALQEYYVLARIFPKDPMVAGRVGETLMTLERPAEAAPWFERALGMISSEEASLRITNRLSQIYGRQLNKPEDARRVLAQYLDQFPNAEYAGSVRKRLDSMAEPSAAAPSSESAL